VLNNLASKHPGFFPPGDKNRTVTKNPISYIKIAGRCLSSLIQSNIIESNKKTSNGYRIVPFSAGERQK
jgi:hypothetical protein